MFQIGEETETSDSRGGGDASNDIDVNLVWNSFKKQLGNIVQDVISFAKTIPGFTKFDIQDQVSLLKAGGFEVRVV